MMRLLLLLILGISLWAGCYISIYQNGNAFVAKSQQLDRVGGKYLFSLVPQIDRDSLLLSCPFRVKKDRLYPQCQKARIDLSYLMKGIFWKAIYHADVATKNFLGFAFIKNVTKEDFRQCRVELIGGEVRIEPVFERMAVKKESMIKRAPLLGYYRFIFPRLMDLGQKEEIVTPFIKKIVTFTHKNRVTFFSLLKPRKKVYANLLITFQAPTQLPAGKIYFYKKGKFIGANLIEYLTKGDRAGIVIGKDFNLWVQKEIKRYKPSKNKTHIILTYKIHHNKKLVIEQKIPFSPTTLRVKGCKLLHTTAKSLVFLANSSRCEVDLTFIDEKNHFFY